MGKGEFCKNYHDSQGILLRNDENFGTNMTKMSKKAAPGFGRSLMPVIF